MPAPRRQTGAEHNGISRGTTIAPAQAEYQSGGRRNEKFPALITCGRRFPKCRICGGRMACLRRAEVSFNAGKGVCKVRVKPPANNPAASRFQI
ncbi:MAG: hypothetical protein DBX55_08295 [Verrucomicrobia bacterium]|nr:MAG: hypothetical protein DBX55_08295 [Verrucomicrobiota bacterium]